MQLQNNTTSLGTKLFLLRVLRNPRQLGAVAPSSRHLGALLARHAMVQDDSPIIELGGGSGSLTRALITAGIHPSRIYVIEVDPELAGYLKNALPAVNIIQGDARDLSKILPSHVVGKINRIVSGLPMINFPELMRRQIMESSFHVMAKEGRFLQYTYSFRSSIDAEAYHLQKKRLGSILLNIPPATVWQYTKK